jgi:hypothetical protein
MIIKIPGHRIFNIKETTYKKIRTRFLRMVRNINNKKLPKLFLFIFIYKSI